MLGQLEMCFERKSNGLDATERANKSWVEVMRRHAVHVCERYGQVTTDDLRDYADRVRLQPKSPNAWGAVLRGPDWREIGRTPSRYTTNNGRKISVWRYEPARGALTLPHCSRLASAHESKNGGA